MDQVLRTASKQARGSTGILGKLAGAPCLYPFKPSGSPSSGQGNKTCSALAAAKEGSQLPCSPFSWTRERHLVALLTILGMETESEDDNDNDHEYDHGQS